MTEREKLVAKIMDIGYLYKNADTITREQQALKCINMVKEYETQALSLHNVVGRSEQLVAFGIWLDKNDKHLENGNITETVKEYLKGD